jgi:microcystin-dependent protein
MAMEKTGYKIRYKGVYRLYRDGVVVKETPYSLLEAFGDVPAITVEELAVMTTPDIEARAALMIAHIAGRCSEFNVINDIIYPSAECVDEEDDFMIGQIIDYAGIENSWDTEKWMNCDGRIVAIADYPELYEVIGHEWTYDNISSAVHFRLPDLRGRVNLGYDSNGKLTPRTEGKTVTKIFNVVIGEKYIENYARIGNLGGEMTAELGTRHLPEHSHPLYIGCGNTRHSDDSRDYAPAKNFAESYEALNDPEKWEGITGRTGANKPHENRPPYAVVYKLIRYK